MSARITSSARRTSARAGSAAIRTVGVIAGLALAGGSLAACSSGGASDGKVEITFLTQNDATTTKAGQAYVDAFMKDNPDITVKLETQPGGSEGDNLVKTKLSTGEMSEVFGYNTGSLLQAINPDDQLVDLSDEDWIDLATDDFISVVSTDNGIYGAPLGTSLAGGVLYNKKVYADLGLDIPTDWDEFMSNSQTIKDAGITAVVQAYGDDWTAQLFVLADFANVDAQDPDWADNYTDNKAKYVNEPALAGFEHQQEAYEAGFFNEDFASLTNDKALGQLAQGTAAQYPMLTSNVGTIAQNYPDQLNDVGYFALPADDAEYTSATIWQPGALYIPKTATGDKLEAAKKFVRFVTASDAGCKVQNEIGTVSGPYVTSACELTGDVPLMIQDVQTYFDSGKTAPALEFLSPIKGPNLPALTVQVGSGISSAKEAAALYDQDVVKQAQQLGLDGW